MFLQLKSISNKIKQDQTRSNSFSDFSYFSALTHSHPITIKNHPGSHECHGGRALAKPPVVTTSLQSWIHGLSLEKNSPIFRDAKNRKKSLGVVINYPSMWCFSVAIPKSSTVGVDSETDLCLNWNLRVARLRDDQCLQDISRFRNFLRISAD